LLIGLAAGVVPMVKVEITPDALEAIVKNTDAITLEAPTLST
jgi:hypothetical protein